MSKMKIRFLSKEWIKRYSIEALKIIICKLLHSLETKYIKGLPDRILKALLRLDDTLAGYQVTRLEHSLPVTLFLKMRIQQERRQMGQI